MRVLADENLPKVSKYFGKPFNLTLYKNLTDLSHKINNADILICRSTVKVNKLLLENTSLKCIATATSGTDHIDKKLLISRDIDLFDAKGSNASAVCDYILSSLALIIKEKHTEINKVGIVGCGEVGSRLAQRLNSLGVFVNCFDPLKSQVDKKFSSCELEDLYAMDAICVHANLHFADPYPSFNLFNKELLKNLKPGLVLINTSRGGIVNEKDLLSNQQKIIYCTDVFANEPNINQQIVDYALISTPHIAGHSIEAKEFAVAMLASKICKKYSLNPPSDYYQNTQVQMPTSWDNLSLSLNSKSFTDFVLSKYSPNSETLALKNATDVNTEFLRLRKNHKFRHSFIDNLSE